MSLAANVCRAASAIRCAAIVASAALLPTTSAVGATAGTALFASDSPLEMRLEAPFGAVNGDRQPEYQPARLTIDGGTVDLRVRQRGKSRAAACPFKPLLLNFRTKDLAGTVLEGQDRLKLVTHCNPSAAYDQYVLVEYLAYRMLGLLTDMTLRARLVKVTYYDTAREREIAVRPGILLEDEDRFAERNGLARIEDESVEATRYDREALGLVYLFEYLIGNTDWSATAGPAGTECCHNVVPYRRADGVLVPIPYDFDSSGLVNVPYALPDERLKIASVRDRLYRGTCEPMENLKPRFAAFEAKRDDILGLLRSQAGLADRTVSRTTAYVESFYEIVADEKKANREFRGKCSR
jgi:hypothetical protein